MSFAIFPSAALNPAASYATPLGTPVARWSPMNCSITFLTCFLCITDNDHLTAPTAISLHPPPLQQGITYQKKPCTRIVRTDCCLHEVSSSITIFLPVAEIGFEYPYIQSFPDG